jgi:hypothetical protein
LGDPGADLGDVTDPLVSENPSDLDLGSVALQDVQVRATDSGGDHLHDHVRWLEDDRIRDFFPTLLARTSVDECLHDCLSSN